RVRVHRGLIVQLAPKDRSPSGSFGFRRALAFPLPSAVRVKRRRLQPLPRSAGTGCVPTPCYPVTADLPRPRLGRIGWGALLLLGAACTSSDSNVQVVSADAELESEVRDLLPDLAARAGLEVLGPVRVERRSRDQLVAYLTRKLEQEFPPEEERHVRSSYALLGLLPSDLDLRQLLLSVYTEQVAGFYDPDSTALFVLEDQPPQALGTVLVHELVHAVQDQTVDL